MRRDVKIQSEPIKVEELIASFKRDDCGAHVVFDGTVRSATKGKLVEYLDFEALHSMALKEMNRLMDRIEARFELEAATLIHREGKVEIGESAVLIMVASPHRGAAFDACRFLIDELKVSVPIWKKEVYKDGYVWVSAHP